VQARRRIALLVGLLICGFLSASTVWGDCDEGSCTPDCHPSCGHRCCVHAVIGASRDALRASPAMHTPATAGLFPRSRSLEPEPKPPRA